MPRMGVIPFTTDEFYECCQEIYSDGKHVPHQAWVDSIGDDVILIRVAFPEEFCKRCAARLEALRILLYSRFGYGLAITYLIYSSDLEELGIRQRSEGLQRSFLRLD